MTPPLLKLSTAHLQPCASVCVCVCVGVRVHVHTDLKVYIIILQTSKKIVVITVPQIFDNSRMDCISPVTYGIISSSNKTLERLADFKTY